ncbi:MAG: hypothetical protein U0792_24275 [Gemmataceae bacterium]
MQERPSGWGYVWLRDGQDEELVNETVLAEGHAVLDTRVPNVKYVERLTAACWKAREAGKNIWNTMEPLPETPAEYVKKNAEAAAVATPSNIRGGVDWEQQPKKYHVPGGQYWRRPRRTAPTQCSSRTRTMPGPRVTRRPGSDSG